MKPLTLEEWFDYIQTIPSDQILSKAKAANSLEFLRGMGAEGMSPSSIGAIIKAFVARMVELDIAVPSRYDGALWDMSELMD
jgi:hypothetical protein